MFSTSNENIDYSDFVKAPFGMQGQWVPPRDLLIMIVITMGWLFTGIRTDQTVN
jgi:hypothetical protein